MVCFYVFVYGTLKPGERAYGRFCEPFVGNVQPAIAPGRIYALPLGYPAMTQEPGWVRGFLLGFNDDAVLAAMDEFEEYYPDRPEASQYQRRQMPIFRPNREPLATAWGYTMSRQQVEALQGIHLPEGVWRERPVS